MSSQQPIFRIIQVGEDQHLSLDAPIPADVLPLMEPVPNEPNQMKMRPGTFHRAQSITVTLAGDENVQRMDFTYDPGTDYQTLLDDYTQELGNPAQNGGSPGAEQRSVWEDSATRFELFANGSGGSARVGSLLENSAPAAA
jgi:hypothetical protein